MTVITARNTRLAEVAKDKPLSAVFVSDTIDFKEMTSGSVQVWRKDGDANDGTFQLLISNLCDEDSFALFPESEVDAACDGQNLIWVLNDIPFRFARVSYTPGTDAVGTASIYARGKL